MQQDRNCTLMKYRIDMATLKDVTICEINVQSDTTIPGKCKLAYRKSNIIKMYLESP
jgi:hypothetical protein